MTARKTFPDDAELAYEVGAVRYRGGDFPAAVRYLQQSIGIRGQNPEALFFLGMSHFQLKNITESRSALQRALESALPEQEANEARRVLEELNRGGQE